MSGLRARSGAGALVAAVALVTAVLPAGMARAGDRHSISGTSSASGAPSLPNGVSSDTLDPGQGKYYTINLADGVNAYLKARTYGHQDKIMIAIYTSAGEKCGSSSDTSFASAWLDPVTAHGDVKWDSSWSGGLDSGCGRPGRYAVRVARTQDTSSGAIPIDLYFLAERPVSSTGGLPGPAGTDGKGPLPDITLAAHHVDGAEREADAPHLTGRQGAISTSVPAGSTAYWRLPTVGWNQRISYILRYDTSSTSGSVTVGVDNMFATGISKSSGYHFNSDQTRISGSTVRVRYRNRESNDSDVYGASWSGPYYLYVSTSPETGTIKATLTYLISGSAGGEPAYGSARGATTARAAFDGGDATLLGMPRTPFAVTAGLLCLAGAAGLALWPRLARLRRRQPVNAR
ncbi:MAG: hypothetical protein ACJ73S_05895 [Mycobacteriales bacterium]